MRFHICALPHTQTTSDFNVCAYTGKIIRFCKMMMDLGHEVFLYAGEENEAECTEHIVCISEEERLAHLDGEFYVNASFDYSLPGWKNFNAKAIAGINERAEDTDILCLIAGVAQEEIAEGTKLFPVEFGIGYAGTFSNFRIFESYAWMHTCYGAAVSSAGDTNGNFYDAVIPNYFDVDDFPFSEEKDDYYLFVGRLIERKGYHIAEEVCERLGARLLIAGGGATPKYGEHVGLVNAKERGALMSRAKAVFTPTTYIEPFGGVAVEAMLCGTPVISTDWGAFTETVKHGLTGYRCRTFAEFLYAAQNTGELLPPSMIRQYAVANFSMKVVAQQYQAYFEQLLNLYGEGWYSEGPVHMDRYR